MIIRIDYTTNKFEVRDAEGVQSLYYYSIKEPESYIPVELYSSQGKQVFSFRLPPKLNPQATCNFLSIDLLAEFLANNGQTFTIGVTFEQFNTFTNFISQFIDI